MKRKKGMGSHHARASQNDEWLTPPSIIKALGPFDLDPCAPVNPPWSMASKHFTIEDDGLHQDWGTNRCWVNPPYGYHVTGLWLSKCADHGNAVALVFARTETEAWHKHIWRAAHAVFFFRGRLNFHHVDGSVSRTNAGAPSALVAYGVDNVRSIRESKLPGHLVVLQ